MSRGDRVAFAVMAVVGVLLHLGMDALNSYGVHPYWPLNNRWMYGDLRVHHRAAVLAGDGAAVASDANGWRS